eukprot:7093874-Ditylum_brightwellii.AAC.1
MGNPLPHALENKNDWNAESRGNTPNAEEVGEGSSDQTSPSGSLFTKDPLLPKTLFLSVNWKLIKVYSDIVHDNDSSHLNGGVTDDKAWQGYWEVITALPSQQYDLTSSAVGRRFIFLLTEILGGIVGRKWNSEQVIVYAGVILQHKTYKDVRRRFKHWMDL